MIIIEHNSNNKKRTIGFIISNKDNEKRRAILPEDLTFIKNLDSLYFETGYGEVLGIQDSAYTSLGCNVLPREDVLRQEIICEPKIGDANYLNELTEGQTIFGWVHALQNKEMTDILVNNKITVFAWEDMFEEGRHIFFQNNMLAGEAAVLNAFQAYGDTPADKKVAVLGRGNSAKGAIKILTQLGAEVQSYDREHELLFKEELHEYDIIVNAVLWDMNRRDYLISKTDLSKMKQHAMIIDVSCDEDGAIETTRATTMNEPTYEVDGIVHYAVDHTPSILYRTATRCISEEVKNYLDQLVENKIGDVLKNALIIDNGKVIDERIKTFQNR